MEFVSYDDTVEFILSNKKIINEVKITKFEKTGFNPLEGNILSINIKLVTTDGYRNKLFTMLTNDTYMQGYESYIYSEIREELQDYLSTLIIS